MTENINTFQAFSEIPKNSLDDANHREQIMGGIVQPCVFTMRAELKYAG